MLKFLKKENDMTYTENGCAAYKTSDSSCLDLFFGAGGMRNTDEKTIAEYILRAYAEDPSKTMKIIFFARDVRGGLGERRFFRIAVKTLAKAFPEAVKRNIGFFSEYGRFDDLCTLIGTPCEKEALNEIKVQLDKDISEYKKGGCISLLAKWLPSVNASSSETRLNGKRIASYLGMSEREYRITLSSLRKHIDIIENRLRTYDYTFDYDKQTSGAMMKYRKAFLRNDSERYKSYIDGVIKGEAKMNASVIYPYEIVRKCFGDGLSKDDAASLDAAWKSLPDYSCGTNAIAVIDGSGSMTWGSSVRPIDAALSLGIYFAEHTKGVFANHFITFSHSPRLVEIKGSNIVEKVRYCETFNEVADTNLEAVFTLILRTAVKNRLKQSELPGQIFIISDMEFNSCVIGGRDITLFEQMKKRFARFGYRLPEVIFWNVNSRTGNLPVKMSDTGAALVSGFTPALFNMVISGEISPEKVMDSIIYSDRYAKIS